MTHLTVRYGNYPSNIYDATPHTHFFYFSPGLLYKTTFRRAYSETPPFDPTITWPKKTDRTELLTYQFDNQDRLVYKNYCRGRNI